MRELPEVDENDEGLRTLIRSQIEPGFLDVDEVLEIAEEWAEDAGLETDGVEAAVEKLWRERLAREKKWNTASDYDRLAAAFEDLEAQGIIARMNFACCTNCATDEIGFERTEHPNQTDGYRYNEWAYTYFHAQDRPAGRRAAGRLVAGLQRLPQLARVRRSRGPQVPN